MATFLFILFILLSITATVGMALYFHSRKILREQKNYERGLKMVPLLIHLPPPSDDIQVGARDTREIVDENISKAQVLYNIIASTLKKGFKSKFYGQRHFAFEIVGAKGFVHFYAAVPIAMVDVVKQAVVSAYPAARLEEVAEHNIFSPVGKISGTIGGELTLKENFAYPIATFQDLKQDTMQALLNALSTLDKEDGVGIQILIRPADSGWRKHAQAVAGKKRKGKSSKKGFDLAGEWAKQLAVAVVKPPEDKKNGGDKPDLSHHEQSLLDAIDDKTNHPGFEVLIRVVASSNIAQRAQTILNNVVASFSLFDAPGRNGFKYTPSKDIDSFVTAYILRFFPQENNQSILNSVELATLFHFPDQRHIPTTQLERQASKQVDGPRNISEDGLFLGYNVFRGVKKPIRLDENDRRRHMYLVGQTGTGKSTLLENLALQDMLNGHGFAFIDPHGDTAERLLAMVPRERTEDVIYFSPADMDYPLGLNLFEYDTPDQKDFLIQEAINMLYKLYDPQHQGIIGPRYEHWFRNAALTVMASPDGGTFIDIPKVFTDKQYERQLKEHVTDQTVLDFWNKEMAQTSDYHKSEVLGWFVSKFGAFLSNEMMRNIIGQSKSSFNLRQVMDEGKILLVNLSKGRTGELNSKLLGMIFVMKFQAAAMSRANMPEEQRKDFSLYVDEFQNFSTDSFATILSEARKYRLSLIVANQFTTQLTEEIRDAVFGNIGSIVSFRVGTNDAEFLAKQFSPIFDIDDLQRIPNYNAVVRMLIGGIPAQPFSMATVPPLGQPNQKLAEALKQLSAAKYGRPKAKIEADIFARLRTPEPPTRPSLPSSPGASPFAAAPPRPAASPFGPPPPATAARPSGYPAAPSSFPPKTPGTGSAFLDEWLTKRKAPMSTQPIAGPSPQLFQRPMPPMSPSPTTAIPAVPAPPSSAPVPQQASDNKPVRLPSTPTHGSGREGKSNKQSSQQVSDPATTLKHKTRTIQPLHPDTKPVIGLDIKKTDAMDRMKTSKPVVPAAPAGAEMALPGKKPASTGHNISSEQLDGKEVSNIAEEIRHALGSKESPKAEKEEKETKDTSKKPSDEIIFNKKPADEPGVDDTIFIDQEGTLHIKQPGNPVFMKKDDKK